MKISIVCTAAACLFALAVAHEQQQAQPPATAAAPVDAGQGNIKQEVDTAAKRKGHRWPTRKEVEERVSIFKAFRADESVKDNNVLSAENLMELDRKSSHNKKEPGKDKHEKKTHKKEERDDGGHYH